MKVYCKKCGSGTSQGFTKAKFCQSCGTSLSESVFADSPLVKVAPKANLVNTKIKFVPKVAKVEVEEEEIDSEPLPEISELQVELAPSRKKGETLGEVIRTDPQGTIRDVPKDVSKEDQQRILEEFKKEASQSSRSSVGDAE